MYLCGACSPWTGRRRWTRVARRRRRPTRSAHTTPTFDRDSRASPRTSSASPSWRRNGACATSSSRCSGGSGLSCFNCLGGHNVTDCPEPVDQRRVTANRRKSQQSRGGGGQSYKTSRESMASKCAAGVIGDDLRAGTSPVSGYGSRCSPRSRRRGHPVVHPRDARARHAHGLSARLAQVRRREGSHAAGASFA